MIYYLYLNFLYINFNVKKKSFKKKNKNNYYFFFFYIFAIKSKCLLNLLFEVIRVLNIIAS